MWWNTRGFYQVCLIFLIENYYSNLKKGKKNRNGLGDASLCSQKSKTPNKTWFASNVILWIQHNINYWN